LVTAKNRLRRRHFCDVSAEPVDSLLLLHLDAIAVDLQGLDVAEHLRDLTDRVVFRV
jgi:hypothetical protein